MVLPTTFTPEEKSIVVDLNQGQFCTTRPAIRPTIRPIRPPILQIRPPIRPIRPVIRTAIRPLIMPIRPPIRLIRPPIRPIKPPIILITPIKLGRPIILYGV